MDKTKKTSVKTNIVYAVGTLGKEVSYAMISVYAMLYLTTFMGLNGVAVGFAICFVRLLSAVADPIMATVVNNTKSKLGRYRPWLIIGAVINLAVLLAMFYPLKTASVGIKYFYYLLMYLLWGVSYTIVDVPYTSMIPSLADTTKEREGISSLSRLLGGFGGFIIGSGGSVIIANSFGVDNPMSYFIVAGVAGLILIVMMVTVILALKERYDLPCQEVKFRDIFKLFKENDQVRAFAGSYLAFTVGANIAISQLIYFFVYDKSLDFNLYIVFNVVSCTGTGLAMMFYTLITKKIPREKVFSLTYLFAGIGMALSFAVFYLFGTSAWGNVIMFSLAAALLMTANGVNQITSLVMITDVVDYGEYKSGVRSDSIMMCVQTMLGKVSLALAMLVLGIGVAVAKLPSIDLLTNTFTGEVNDKMLLIFRIFVFLAPLPLMPVGYLFYKKNYKLYGKFYDEVKVSIETARKK